MYIDRNRNRNRNRLESGIQDSLQQWLLYHFKKECMPWTPREVPLLSEQLESNLLFMILLRWEVNQMIYFLVLSIIHAYFYSEVFIHFFIYLVIYFFILFLSQKSFDIIVFLQNYLILTFYTYNLICHQHHCQSSNRR